MIEYRQGNILESEAEALVNTVNTYGVMGKGIAMQFQRAFPDMAKEYAKACKREEVVVGKMHVWKNVMFSSPKFIINFPTKQHWRNPSKMEYIRAGLQDLIAVIQSNQIRSIAIPPLGCGLGGLDWSRVKEEIQGAFHHCAEVQVFLYEPIGEPAPRAMINKTQIPSLTPATANLIRIIHQYTELENELRLLEVQKLVYFFQIAGQPFNLIFQKEKYGPYADELRHVLNRLEGHYISGSGAGDTRPHTQINLLPGAIQKASEYFESSPDLESLRRADKVKNLIYGFESPYGMELLASVHWVATVLEYGRVADTVEEAIAAIQSWNPRKKRVMKPEHITKAWNRLNTEGWITPSFRNGLCQYNP